MVLALAKEMVAEKGYLGGEIIDTIYFGGGTPSLLSISDLQLLISALRQQFTVAGDAEVTLEANPDDINLESLHEWKARGITRLSIGVQSFFEEELRWMNRAHNSQLAVDSLELAIKAFDNITMDLIYGSPMLTDEMWKQNVDRAVNLGIPHLSCYALTVEEKTPLQKKINAQQTPDVDNDKQARQFLLLMQWLEEAGYEHYEVSNFAKPGFRSRHNSSYWKGVKYLGLGPSAHSFNGTERRWNVTNNTIYIKGINEARLQRETEILTPSQQLNEAIMISLRTMEGIDLSKIGAVWGKDERSRIESDLLKFTNAGLIKLTNGHAQLTNEGMLRADGIAADLFV
jgi:oxygen-independent coproporphyrinogen-3 oxidase